METRHLVYSLLALVIIVVVVVLVGAAAVMYRRKAVEAFAVSTAGYNSREIYRAPCPDIDVKKAKQDIKRQRLSRAETAQMYKNLDDMCTFDGTMQRLKNTLSDRMDMLIMNKCVGSKSDELINKIKADALTQDYPILTISIENATFQKVRDRIQKEVQDMAKRVGGKLYGPSVYALIYQTHAMTSTLTPSNRITFINSNVKSYGYQPVSPDKINKRDSPMLNYTVFLFFPSIRLTRVEAPKNRVVQKVANAIVSPAGIKCRLKLMDPYQSNEEMCFVRCLGETTSGKSRYATFCGCKTDEKQGSRCLGDTDVMMDYGVMYEINPKFVGLQEFFMNGKQRSAFEAATAKQGAAVGGAAALPVPSKRT